MDLFKSLAKLLRVKRIHIEGPIFRLHSTLTVLILMVFAINCTAKQIWGDPMLCDVDKKSVNVKMADSYCYVMSTFSIVEADSYRAATYPGLGHSARREFDAYHWYYQWVWCVLLFQAICFYLPRWLWKSYEGDKISCLVSKIDYFGDESEKTDQKMDRIVNYFVKTIGTHNQYVFKYFLCEVITYVNVIVQVFVLDLFFGGKFLSLGLELVRYQFDTTMLVSPLVKVFPLLSQCPYNRTGITGSWEKFTFLCLLTNNVVNQKIFAFLWFWYLFLAIITIFVLIFRGVLIFCPAMRYQCCRYRFDFKETKGIRVQKLVIDNLYIGDWFILYLLSHNIEPIVFSEILNKLCDQLKIDSKSDCSEQQEERISINKGSDSDFHKF